MLSIPIVSSFDGSGIEKAKKEFAQLDGAAAKTKFAFKKALIPATAAVAGLGAALFDAGKGAIEDAAAQELLTKALKNNTAATDVQIKANEDWISTQGKLLGVTDDELRPAIAKLATQTGDLKKAQEGASLAMDIAAATGKPLSAVTDALAKAYGGNTKALAKLDPKLKDLVKEGLDAEGAMSVLADTFGGAATTKANTAEGQFQRLSVSLAETKETIGAALLPIVEKVLPYLTKLGDWAANNTGAFLTIAGVIGGIAGAVLLVNGAIAAWTAITTAATAVQLAFNAVLALNPITLIVLGIGLLIAALAAAYFKFEGFRKVVDSVFKFIGNAVSGSIDLIKSYFTGVLGFYKAMFNGIASLWNNTFGKLSFKIPSFVPGIGGKGFDVPNIPMLAEGGIVNKATLAVIGESGPEAVVPLSRAGEFGMGGGNNVTIHVNGGDPNAVVQALRTYMRQNGSVPIRVSNIF
jgi:phage-related protein